MNCSDEANHVADCFRDGDDSGGPECVVSPLIDNLEHVFLVGGLSRGFASQDDVVLRADENVEPRKGRRSEDWPLHNRGTAASYWRA